MAPTGRLVGHNLHIQPGNLPGHENTPRLSDQMYIHTVGIFHQQNPTPLPHSRTCAS